MLWVVNEIVQLVGGAQTELKARKGVEARVVPNVFDYSQDPWVKDDYNGDFRASLGIGESDLVSLGGELAERDARNLVTVCPEFIRRAAEGVILQLQDAGFRKAVVGRNFGLAREHFSYEALEGILRDIFAEKGISWQA